MRFWLLKKRSSASFWLSAVSLLAFAALLTSCGKNFYFAGRSLPPSGVLNRVLIAEQSPGIGGKGALPFVDAYYDIRHPYNTSSGNFQISGYSGSLPVTIQNLPEQQIGAVYGAGDGSFEVISYARESSGVPIAIPGGLSSSIFIDQPRQFIYAANGLNHVISVVDLAHGISYVLNLPNVYRVSVAPGGAVALAFVQNSTQAPSTSSCVVANMSADSSYNPSQNPSATPPVSCTGYIPNTGSSTQFSVYSVVALTSPQQQAASTSADPQHYLGAQDCEPQNLPAYCIYPVSTGPNASFDNPVKAVFTPDGSAAYVLNCGPECGGSTAGVTLLPLTASALNSNTFGARGIALVAQSNIAIPGGVTDADFNGNTLYLAGQQLQPDHLFQGFLTVLDTQSGAISGTFPISDGTHNKMVFGDQNTLWIGSSRCLEGETYKNAQASNGTIAYGCLTMFNTANNSVMLDAYKGDATGIAAVTGLDKVYTAEGGQVYIYNTSDGSERDNANVAVTGVAADVAYMDAGSDADNDNY